MKKITILLFILCGIILTSCETHESSNIDEPDPIDQQNILFDPNETYTLDNTPNPLNLEIDTTDELMLVVDQLLDKLKMFEIDDAPNEPYFIEEYPLIRSDLDFMNTKRVFDQPYNYNGLNVFHTLGDMKNKIVDQSNFEEDVWQVNNSLQQDNTPLIADVFKIFVNDQEVYFSYYKKIENERIIGKSIWISNADDILEYSIAENIYDYGIGIWHQSFQSYYKENDINYTWIVDNDGEEFNRLDYIEFNYLDDSMLHLKIDHSVESEFRKQVIYYNPVNHIYFNKRYINDEEDYSIIVKYNAFNQTIFEIHKDHLDALVVVFNLMLIDGWDHIDRINFTNRLYDNEQEIVFPDGVDLICSAYTGIYLRSDIQTTDSIEKFNLENSGLTTPIDYEEYLNLEDQIRTESMTMINDFYTDEYIANIEYHYALIFNQFDINAFYIIAQDYITE